MKEYGKDYDIKQEELEKWRKKFEYQRILDLKKKLIDSGLQEIDLLHNNIISRDKVIDLFGDREKVESMERFYISGTAGYTGYTSNVNVKQMVLVRPIVVELDKWLDTHKSWLGSDKE